MSPGKGNRSGSHPRLLRNSGVAACLMSLGFRLYLKRGILVSVCEDLVTRLVTGTGFLGHALQYVQMRCHFRLRRSRNELGASGRRGYSGKDTHESP
jgi:hypothetical protein